VGASPVVALLGPDQAPPGMRRAVWIIFLPLIGCGHPATVQECDVIVERIAQFELQKHARAADQKVVAQEVAETKRSLREQTMKDCVGRRITNRAMRCVRDAKSSKEIIDECFN
jgi:hypothetical protein